MLCIKIRNKNKYKYWIKSKIRKYIYRTPFLFKNYLALKQLFIKNILTPGIENMLFQKIFIETVSYCNNDCGFCPASTKVGIKHAENFMAEDLYVKILNELVHISFSGSVAFHCNNEPLLDERLSSWIKAARSLLKTNFFYLYTNGVLIDVKLANQLFKAGLNRLIIDNYNDKHELIPSVKELINCSSFLKGEVIVNYRFKTDYLGNRAGQSVNAAFFLKEPLRIMCMRPLREIVIGYDGTVPLCCADGLWKVTMGNAKEENLKNIWFSDFFRENRKALLRGDRNCTEICRVCDALNFSMPKGMRE